MAPKVKKGFIRLKKGKVVTSPSLDFSDAVDSLSSSKKGSEKLKKGIEILSESNNSSLIRLSRFD